MHEISNIVNQSGITTQTGEAQELRGSLQRKPSFRSSSDTTSATAVNAHTIHSIRRHASATVATVNIRRKQSDTKERGSIVRSAAFTGALFLCDFFEDRKTT